MERMKYLTLFTSIVLLILVVFYPLGGDMTIRFVVLCVSFSMLSYLISERKTRRIVSLATLVIMILVVILGFAFSYFK